MKIQTSYPGQEVRIVDALKHIVDQINAGRTFPFIEVVLDENGIHL